MSLLRRLSLATAVFFAWASGSEAQIPALATALDTPALAWDTGGTTSWAAQGTVTSDGVDAARATGLSALDSESWIRTTIAAPGILTWQWRLDLAAESGSVLEIWVGDESIPRASLTASTGWSAASAAIDGSGPVNLRWRLRRVAPADEVSPDTAYLDTVAYSPFGPPVLQSPADLSARGFTARWSPLAQATTYAVEWSTSADFSVSALSEPVPAPATSALITGLEPSTVYYYRLVARGPESLSARSAPLTLTTPAPSRPANDAFAAASALSGLSGATAATTAEATREPLEPTAHASSVWFRWTAPSAGLWRFQTSPSPDASPLLFVYTGATLGELELAAAGGASQGDGSTRVEFEAEAGRTYRIALDALGSGQAATTLSWERLAAYTPPAHDAFASALALSGLSGSVDGSNLHATAETGEIDSARHSVWYTWKAPASGVLTLHTSGSAIGTTLSLWSGSTLPTLTLLGSDSAPPPAASQVLLTVTKDVIYRISLDGQSGAQGGLRLSWSLAVPSLAQTIDAPLVPDLPVDAPAFALQASASSGLPVSFALLSGPATLEGETLTLTRQPGLVRIRAYQPGDGVHLPAETIFQITVQPPPANDAATAPQTLANAAGSLEADLRYATAEAGDAFPAHRSRWYRWTAPGSGILVLNTEGGAIPATLCVYSDSPGSLDPVASDTRPGIRPRLEIPVVGGVGHLVVLDTLEETAGVARLSWSFSAPALAQTITFPAPPDVGVSAAPFALEAGASSGLPVVFTLLSGPATLSGDLLSPSGKPGLVSVRASQPGDAYYKPAPDVVVSFAVRPPPSNDDAAAAIRLGGASGSVNGSTVDASSEPLDPAPSLRSVWWVWTAPATGQWTVDTAGSARPFTLSLLTGASPASLEPVAADLRAEAPGRLTISAYKGVTYWIVVDSLGGEEGAVKLSWSLAPPALEQTILFDQPLPDLVVGDPAPTLSPSASSGLPVDLAVVSGPASLVDGALVLGGKPGKVTLRATQAGDALYQAAPPVVRSFTVAPLPAIKFSFADLRQTYDGTPRRVLVTTDPAPRVSDLAVTYNGAAEAPVAAGTYTVVATADKSRATAKLVVAKAPLLVTAHDQYRYAGEENPPLTFGYSGFLVGDDESKLLRAPLATTSATVRSPGGVYPIRVSGASAANYTFTYAPGRLQVDTFAGRYEALLYDSAALPAGKLELTVLASGRAYTGRIVLAAESSSVPLRGDLDLSSATGLAGDTVESGSYRLTFDLVLDGRFTAVLERDGAYFAAAPSGRRVFVPPSGQKLAWRGAHTALLSPASDAAASGPAGSGHATASIDTKGNLKLTGRLGDDTPFTASLAPDEDGAYRVFALPYSGLRDSYLAGELPLRPHPETARFPGRRYLPASAETTLTWTKAPAPGAKAYAAGFGPLYPRITLDPWIKPAAAFPVALSFAPLDLDLGERAGALPDTGRLSAAGAFTLVSPATTPANLARFTLKLTPSTGAFSGSFVLSDQVAPAPAAPERRTVTFKGVLRTPPAAELAPGSLLGAGGFLLDPLSSSTGTDTVSGQIRILVP